MTFGRTLQILIVDDERVIRDSLSDFLRKLGHLVRVCGNAEKALTLVEDNVYDMVLLDIRMPGKDGLALFEELRQLQPELSVIMITGHGSLDTAIQALRLGASDFLKKPINLEELEAAVEKSVRLNTYRTEQRRLRGAIRAIQTRELGDDARKLIVGESSAMAELRRKVELAASSACRSILITGETGTGKEVVAQTLHRLKHKGTDPFIAVNCPALPETLIESELFGHVRGAFTGATADRMGSFELANGGTLFLDEISDLAAAAQAKLLRVLESRTVRRIGGDREKPVDVTVVVASNRDLDRCIEEGTFRSDLYYRLNTFQIEILPLRARRDDILPLARHFLGKCLRPTDPACRFSTDVEKLLLDYDYPGNARELRNIVERAVILSQGDVIGSEHLTMEAHVGRRATPTLEDLPPRLRQERDEAEATAAALRESNWIRSEAARNLGISYDALRWRIKKYSLSQ